MKVRILVRRSKHTLRLLAALLGAFGSALGVGCGALFDFDALERGQSSDGAANGGHDGDADGDGSGTTATGDGGNTSDVAAETAASSEGGCPSRPGPTQVRIDDYYCIDSTEVTRSHYLAFLTATDGGASAPKPASVCDWNQIYEPETPDWPPHDGFSLPIANINWCAAASYCLWAGKYLCRGNTSASLPTHEADETYAQWFRACSKDGTRAYPFGNDWEAGACNVFGNGVPSPLIPSGSLTTCRGGYDGLFDMSGNVAEWIDACDPTSTPREDACAVQGGSFGTEYSFARCEAYDTHWRWETSAETGIRCCGDP